MRSIFRARWKTNKNAETLMLELNALSVRAARGDLVGPKREAVGNGPTAKEIVVVLTDKRLGVVVRIDRGRICGVVDFPLAPKLIINITSG